MLVIDEHLGSMLTLAFGALMLIFPRVFNYLVGIYLVMLIGLGFAR